MTVVVLLVLIASQLAVIGRMAAERDRHMRADLLARLDPVALDRYPRGDAARAIPRRRTLRLVLLGDSRAEAWPALRDTSVEVFGRGISSQTSAQVAARYAAHVAPLAPTVVVVQAGFNDIARIPEGADPSIVVARATDNLRQIIDEAGQSKTVVVLATIFPPAATAAQARGDGPAPVWSADADEALREINRRVRAMARPGIIVLDAAVLLSGPDGYLQPRFAMDFAHANAAGYIVLNTALESLLAARWPEAHSHQTVRP